MRAVLRWPRGVVGPHRRSSDSDGVQEHHCSVYRVEESSRSRSLRVCKKSYQDVVAAAWERKKSDNRIRDKRCVAEQLRTSIDTRAMKDNDRSERPVPKSFASEGQWW
jgi:hypothetical protein